MRTVPRPLKSHARFFLNLAVIIDFFLRRGVLSPDVSELVV